MTRIGGSKAGIAGSLAIWVLVATCTADLPEEAGEATGSDAAGVSHTMTDLAAAQQTLDAWVALWNTYDLVGLADLFVTDSTLTYLSSETEGLIRGFDALVSHHEGFGFAEGGADTESSLWLESLELDAAGSAVIATAVWYFQSAPTTDEVGRGPVTFVLVEREGGYRIQHAHFANY